MNLSQEQGKTVLTLQGENLAIAASLENFPVAAINDQTVEVMAASETELKLQVNAAQLDAVSNQLKIALDPYAIVTMNLKP